MNNKRIVFMGTPSFAVASLEALVKAGCGVATVVTAPDRPAGRGMHVRESAVKECAMRLGLSVMQPADLRDRSFLDEIELLQADLFVVVAFRKLPVELWSMPSLGTINLHASLLPDYRGAAPINWAIINGEARTGVTTFFIQEKIDTGDVLLQEAIDIGPMETAGELHDRLRDLGARTLLRTLSGIFDGTLSRVVQASMIASTQPRTAPKLDRTTAMIRWDRPVTRVHDLVRGLSPSPGAWCRCRVGDASPAAIKILRTASTQVPASAPPGSVHIDGQRLQVACTDGWIELLDVQPEGRRRMSADEMLRGLRGAPITFVT